MDVGIHLKINRDKRRSNATESGNTRCGIRVYWTNRFAAPLPSWIRVDAGLSGSFGASISSNGLGASLALVGDTLVVGATGKRGDTSGVKIKIMISVSVLARSDSQWSEQAYIKASNHSSQSQPGFAMAFLWVVMLWR